MPQGGATGSRAQAETLCSWVSQTIAVFSRQKERWQSNIMAESQATKSAPGVSSSSLGVETPSELRIWHSMENVSLSSLGKEPRGRSPQDADSHLPRHTDCTKKMDFILFDEGLRRPWGGADSLENKGKLPGISPYLDQGENHDSA